MTTMPDLGKPEERIAQMIENAEAQDDVEPAVQRRQVVDRHVLADLDLRLEQLPRQRQPSSVGPVLRGIVGGDDDGGAAALRIETPIAVPRPNFQHGLAAKIEPIELLFDEAPDEPDDVDVLVVGTGHESVAEIEVVVPLDAVDACLRLGAVHSSI